MVHGNQGRMPSDRLSEETKARIVELADESHAHVDDSHLSELLAEREGIIISRAALRRLLRGAGRPAPRRRRPAGHRSRRDRRSREGLLLQTDGSRHDWLGDRGPRLTLVGMIDDATSGDSASTLVYGDAILSRRSPIRVRSKTSPARPHVPARSRQAGWMTLSPSGFAPRASAARGGPGRI